MTRCALADGGEPSRGMMRGRLGRGSASRRAQRSPRGSPEGALPNTSTRSRPRNPTHPSGPRSVESRSRRPMCSLRTSRVPARVHATIRKQGPYARSASPGSRGFPALRCSALVRRGNRAARGARLARIAHRLAISARRSNRGFTRDRRHRGQTRRSFASPVRASLDVDSAGGADRRALRLGDTPVARNPIGNLVDRHSLTDRKLRLGHRAHHSVVPHQEDPA